MSFVIIPNKTDLLSVIVCSAGFYLQGLDPKVGAVEQFSAVMISKNIAANTSVIPNDLPLTEEDILIGVSRAGISKFQKRDNKRVGMDAVRGLMSNLAAKYLSMYI